MTFPDVIGVVGAFASVLTAIIAAVSLPVVVWQIVENRRFQAAQLIVSSIDALPALLLKFRDEFAALEPSMTSEEWVDSGFGAQNTLNEISRHLHVVWMANKFAPGFANDGTILEVLNEMLSVQSETDRLSAEAKEYPPGEPWRIGGKEVCIRDWVFIGLMATSERNHRRASSILGRGAGPE